MKTTISKVYPVLILLLMVLSCQKESLNPENNSYKDSVNTYKTSLTEFGDKNHLKNYLKKLKTKTTSYQSRFEYDSINDFTVYTDTFTVLENGNRQWLVFNIFRSLQNDKLENLVLQSVGQGIYLPYLYQYNFNESDIENLNTGIGVEDIASKIKIISLDSYEPNIFNRGGYTQEIERFPDGRCGVFNTVVYHDNNIIIMAYTVVPCPENQGGGAGGANNGDGGNNNGGINYSDSEWRTIFNNFIGNNHYYDQYGNGGSPTGTNENGGYINLPNDPNDYYIDITIPVTPPQVDNNLVFLNNITSNTRLPYKQKIAELVQALNDSLESGYEFFNANGSITFEQVESTAANGIQFDIPTLYSFIRMHNHPVGIDPVFSEKDIIGMVELFAVVDDLGATNAQEVTSILVTPLGLFALKVDNPDKVIAFNQEMKTGIDENYVSENENFQKDYEKFVTYTPLALCNGCQQEVYFEYMDEYLSLLLDEWQTGLSLYKATQEPDGTYTWTKVNNN